VDLALLLSRLPLCLLAAKLPIAVMGLGVREALVVLAFVSVAPADGLLAASLLFSAVEQVLPGVVGLLFAGQLARRLAG